MRERMKYRKTKGNIKPKKRLKLVISSGSKKKVSEGVFNIMVSIKQSNRYITVNATAIFFTLVKFLLISLYIPNRKSMGKEISNAIKV